MEKQPTPKPTERRKLSFHSLDEVVVELDRLEPLPLIVLGNWSVGQILMHLSVPMNGAIDGMDIRMPWYLRMGASILKPFVLKMRMPAGFKLPPQAAALMVPGPTTREEGFSSLRRAISRLQLTTLCKPHPVMGQLSVAEWKQLMCRHCELHLGFIEVDRNSESRPV